jgi:hypothetical protein
MAITTTRTITDEAGNTYPFLALTLATSPRWEPASVGASVAIRLVPYRVDETGAIHHLDSDLAVVFPDAVAQAAGDPALAAALQGVAAAIQAFVTAKGI